VPVVSFWVPVSQFLGASKKKLGLFEFIAAGYLQIQMSQIIPGIRAYPDPFLNQVCGPYPDPLDPHYINSAAIPDPCVHFSLQILKK
jgi:hypothetical protein